jgi:hypothetical protein
MKVVQQSDVLWMLVLLLACLTVVCETSVWATFDASVCVIPAPGALLLGVFGAALVGRWHRGRMA